MAKRTTGYGAEQECCDTGHREMTMDRSTPPRAPEGAILRLALAMRGGVSLAVWIGGAMRELDRLQRPDAFTRALLEATVFSRAEIDILAGASAGGLNAAIGGYAMSRDQPVELRDVWIQVADIDRLLEPSKDGSRASVLDGAPMPEPEVGVPGAIVEAEATDLATPTDDLLVRLELLPKEGEQDVGPFSGTPYSLQVITAGALEINKVAVAIIASLGGLSVAAA